MTNDMTGFLEGLRELLREVEAALLNTHNRPLHERVLDTRLRADRLLEELK
jgi:hypothetical protein